MGTEKKRTDAERRARQCERLSRLLRILKLIMGPGRWDAEALARELECSRRTVYRDLQTLSMANVPWQYDEKRQAYRVLPGFKFPELSTTLAKETQSVEREAVLTVVRELLERGESFLNVLREFRQTLEQSGTNHSS